MFVLIFLVGNVIDLFKYKINEIWDVIIDL